MIVGDLMMNSTVYMVRLSRGTVMFPLNGGIEFGWCVLQHLINRVLGFSVTPSDKSRQPRPRTRLVC